MGHGFYIWENNLTRAYQWAVDKKKRGTLKKPAVVGVVYQLNYCLVFTDLRFIEILSTYYQLMKKDLLAADKTLPKNKDLSQDQFHDLILRDLDCSVIEYLHNKISLRIEENLHKKKNSQLRYFDTVRGVFTEGGPAFDGAGIQTKSHIQICIRNLNCIKGFFLPRKEINFP